MTCGYRINIEIVLTEMRNVHVITGWKIVNKLAHTYQIAN